MVDYFKVGRTINGPYCVEDLRRLRQEILKKRRGMKRGVMLLQDNAPANTSKLLWLLRLISCRLNSLSHTIYWKSNFNFRFVRLRDLHIPREKGLNC